MATGPCQIVQLFQDIVRLAFHAGRQNRYVSSFSRATIHLGPGETDLAFKGLEQAYQERLWYLTLLAVDLLFDRLRGDARFTDLVRRMNLTAARLAAADAPPPLLHPEMAELYRQKITALAQALGQSETRTEASEALRGLIDAIVMVPDQGELRIELRGHLAAMLGAAQYAKRSPETGDLNAAGCDGCGGGF